jgi:tetratricopeptide (TPR) repeat protein
VRWRALAAQDDALQFRPDLDLRRRGVEAMDALAPALTLGHRTETAWRRCYLARVTGDTARALAFGQHARELAGELGDPRWIASVDVEMAYLHAAGGRHEAAREVALEACARADAAGDAWLGARALSAQAYVRAEAGELAESQRVFVRAAEEFKRQGDRRREALNHGNAASVMLTIGRVDEAAQEMEAAIEAAGRVGNLPTVATSTHNLGVARRMLGDFDAAAAMQERAEALAAELKHARLACHVAIERVYLALASGRAPDACIALAEAALGRAREVRSPAIVASALASALRACARAGSDVTARVAEARTVADALTAPEPRAELRVAIWEAGGRAEDDRVAARAAIEAVAAGLDEADDRSASRAAFSARYLVPGDWSRG